jgi:5'-deoxynucleotidase
VRESKETVVSPFFAYLFRLRFIQRWNLMRSALPENVAEHSYDVALLTHALCTIRRDVYGTEMDTGRAVVLALFHDVVEVITGDIPSPVKHHDAAIQQNLRAMESLAGEQLLSMVPDELLPAYRPLVRAAESDRDLLSMVKAADKLSAYLKCASEIAAGNREFAVAKRQLERIVRDFHSPEVDYFLEHFAPSFDQTLDEISS